jgi:SAM-dependent methyltransferase
MHDIASHGAYVNLLCPLCGAEGRKLFQIRSYDIDKCLECGFVYVRNVPSHEFLAECYRGLCGTKEEYAPQEKFGKKLKNWWFAKRISYLAKNRRRVLEVGYAHGNLLKALQREARFEIEGIDYTEGPLQHLQSLGLNVSLSSLEDKNYPDGHFDIVVGLHVLEHVQNPIQFICEVRRVLSPGGLVYLQLPCLTYWRARLAGARWRGFSPPYHLWFFSPRTARLFLSKYGFRVRSAHCLSNRAHLTVVAEKA